MRGANGCRGLGRFLAVCLCVLVGSGVDGFESQLMRCVAMPFMGRLVFSFIGQGKAWVIVEEKEENEKEKKSSRIAGSFFSFMRVPPTLYSSTRTTPHHGPIHHWHHVQVLSSSCGAPLCPSGRRGELMRPSVYVRGLCRIAPVRPTLFLM